MPRQIWRDGSGTPIACLEKLRLLDENAVELHGVMQDVWEDALLMGVDPAEMRAYLETMVKALSEGPET